MAPRAGRAAALLLTVACLAACATAVRGTPHPAVPGAGRPPDPATVAAAVLQAFWADRFPATFDRPWHPVRVLVPVRAGDARPPCVNSAAQVANQAYYCPAADAVAWDADGLVPDLTARFGPVGVVVVLAHEIGHAVQTRLGIDEVQRTDPRRHPAILLELMADCYAGVALRHLAEGGAPGFEPGWTDPDAALRAITEFRDPLGVAAADPAAHGNAFDRVSAFQDGFTDGPARCAGMSIGNRRFTQRAFGSAADLVRGGDLPLSDMLEVVSADAQDWFGEVGAARGAPWRPPTVDGRAPVCNPGVLAAQGPVRYCAADGTVTTAPDLLASLHDALGDYAGATLLAGRYGLALLGALGVATDGPDAGRAAVCLAGAYTGRLVDPLGSFRLSPGDLDEAVQVLLMADWAARDARGEAAAGARAFQRMRHFAEGLRGGADRCLLNSPQR